MAEKNRFEEAKNNLIEAFPKVDRNVIEAVLNASGGNIEPAFNALMNDEELARHLALESGRDRSKNRSSHSSLSPRFSGKYFSDEREHSFIDDDLPVIKDSLIRGLAETRSRIGSWVNNIANRIDGNSIFGSQESSTFSYGKSGSDRYDGDPDELDHNLNNIRMSSIDQEFHSNQKKYGHKGIDLLALPPKPPRPMNNIPNTLSGAINSASQNKIWMPIKGTISNINKDTFAVDDSEDDLDENLGTIDKSMSTIADKLELPR